MAYATRSGLKSAGWKRRVGGGGTNDWIDRGGNQECNSEPQRRGAGVDDDDDGVGVGGGGGLLRGSRERKAEGDGV